MLISTTTTKSFKSQDNSKDGEKRREKKPYSNNYATAVTFQPKRVAMRCPEVHLKDLHEGGSLTLWVSSQQQGVANL